MDVGQTISRTFGVVKDRFGSLLGLWAIFFAIQLGMMAILGISMGASAMAGLAMGNANAVGGGMVVILFLFYIVYFLITFAQYGAMTAMASPLKQVSFGDAFNIGLRSAPTLLGVFILFMIGYLVFALVFGIVGGILSMAGSVGALLAIILVVPAAIYLMCRISVVNAVASVDRVGNPVTVLARSWAMTSGKVLPIFAVLLIFGIAMMLLMGVLAMPLYASIRSSMMGGGVPNFGSFGLIFVGMLLLSVVIAVVFAALLAVIHSEVSGQSSDDMGAVFA